MEGTAPTIDPPTIDPAASEGANQEPADWVKWFSWRGSPQLVAQVARAAQRAAGADVCSIVVSVRGDQEVFASPANFAEDVTPEALRDFSSIRISAAGTVTLQ